MEVALPKEVDRPAALLPSPATAKPAAPTPARHPARILAAGVALGALFDFLVYGQRVGVGFTLIAVACVAALFAIYAGEWRASENEGQGERRKLTLPHVAALTAATLFFAAMASVRGGPILQAMNLAVAVLLGCLLVHRFQAKTCADLTMTELFLGPFWMLGVVLCESSFVLAAVQSQMPDRGQRAGIVKTAIRGVLLAVVPLMVFVALLSSADPLFARGANAVVAWLFPTDFVLRLWRVGVASMVAILATGALATAVRRRPAPSSGATAGAIGDAPAAPAGFIGVVESMIVLVSVGAVFAAFVSIQFANLFGGAGRVLAVPDLTYAEYARSGFNELVWVAVLALTLISVLRSATRLPERGTALTSFRIAAMGLIGMTLIVLFSAVQRMNAYEAAYGATATRLAVDTFIATLALALLWRAATLFAGPRRPTFAAGLLVCAVGFCATIDLQSPQAAAVNANVARYRATGEIDADYLVGGIADDPDAVPALCDALRAAKSGTPLHHRLRERLLEARKDGERDAREDVWTAANLSRQMARKALADTLNHP